MPSIPRCPARSATFRDTTVSASQPLTINGVTATVGITSDWGNGYGASVTLSNANSTTVTGWQIVLATGGSTVSQLWSGTYTQSGTQVTVSAETYNAPATFAMLLCTSSHEK